MLALLRTSKAHQSLVSCPQVVTYLIEFDLTVLVCSYPTPAFHSVADGCVSLHSSEGYRLLCTRTCLNISLSLYVLWCLGWAGIQNRGCQIGTRYGVQGQHQAVCDILIMADNCASVFHTRRYEYLYTSIVIIIDRADERSSRSSSIPVVL